jgi:anthranilate synthase component 2
LNLLIIDNYDSFTYNLVQLIKQCGVTGFDIVKNDKLLNLSKPYDKILISPGPGIAAEAGQLMEFLRQNHTSSSILGICLGQEAVVELFGGKHKKLVHPLHGYRNKASIANQHYIFKNLPVTFGIGHYHSWYVDEQSLPDALEVLVRDEQNLIMGVTHKRFDVTGLLFHPESVMTDFGREMIGNWVKNGREQ